MRCSRDGRVLTAAARFACIEHMPAGGHLSREVGPLPSVKLTAASAAVALAGSQQEPDDEQTEHQRYDPRAFGRGEDRDGQRRERRADGEDDVGHRPQLG